MGTLDRAMTIDCINEIENLIGEIKMKLTSVQDISSTLITAKIEPTHFMISDIFRKTTTLKRLICKTE